jgi:hypothetical protein
LKKALNDVFIPASLVAARIGKVTYGGYGMAHHAADMQLLESSTQYVLPSVQDIVF